jgi:hypothetical protein
MKRSAYPALLGLLFSGATLVMGQTQDAEVTGDHAECVFFGVKRAEFMTEAMRVARAGRASFSQ